MLNPSSWGWGAKTGFFWAASGAICAVWTYFRVPEPKGRSYAEMDMLFAARISARKFKHTDVADFATVADRQSESEQGDTKDEKAAVRHAEHASGT